MFAGGVTHCCAISEFEGLNQAYFKPEEAIREIGQHFCDKYYEEFREDHRKPMFAHMVMFQKYGRDTNKDSGCKNYYALRDLINEHDLGTLTEGPVKINPNSGNKILPVFFSPDRAKFERYLRDVHGITYRDRPPASSW